VLLARASAVTELAMAWAAAWSGVSRFVSFPVLSLAAFAGACASMPVEANLPVEHSERLEPQPISAAAPAGLAILCRDESQLCGAAPSVDPPPVIPRAVIDQIRDLAPQPEELFQTLLARRGLVVHTTTLEAPSPEPLTPARWRDLNEVNWRINRVIRPTTDAALYGVEDRWALPITAPARGISEPAGDCEDYALEKRAALLRLGWSASALSLAIALAPTEGLHAVLVAHTDHGDFVLDNLFASPILPSQSRYQWVKLQTGSDLLAWREVFGPSAAAPRRPSD